MKYLLFVAGGRSVMFNVPVKQKTILPVNAISAFLTFATFLKHGHTLLFLWLLFYR